LPGSRGAPDRAVACAVAEAGRRAGALAGKAQVCPAGSASCCWTGHRDDPRFWRCRDHAGCRRPGYSPVISTC